jgi:NAD(P)H-dependent FMN reductase
MSTTKAGSSDALLHVLAVSGSMNRDSVTRVVMGEVARQLTAHGCKVDLLDLREEALPLFNPDSSYGAAYYPALKQRLHQADVVVLGTPDYHGSVSSAMKNFLDHFWREFAGKLIGTIVASHEKGLTVTDQLRTVARQCYAWSLPYGVSFVGDEDVKEGKVHSPGLAKRLEMMSRDLAIYGRLLATQRRADLASKDPGFLAKHR